MKSRRGLASVVGTVFAIIALATTVGYITYSMNVLDNYNQAVLARNQQSTDIAKESFALGGVTFTSGSKLNMTVYNTGSLPINFTKVWITNKTSSPTAWVKSYTPSGALVAPGKSLINLGINNLPALYTNKPYHVKLVTSRGNTAEFDVTSTGSSPLDIRFYALPPTIVTSFSTELVMLVINNSTNGATLTNIIPSITDTTACATQATLQSITGPTPSSYPTLAPGQTAYFKWDLSLSGANGACRSYTVSLVGGIASNTATTTVSIITVPVSLQSGTSVQSLGLSANTVPTNTLILHKETNTNPANTNQLWSGNAETAGTSIVPSSSPVTWITNNDSSSTVTVPAGAWVLSTRYVSDKVPTGFPTADLIYHFDTISAAITKDSSGNAEDLTATGSPTVSFTGVNSSNTIPLSGSGQYFSRTATFDTHDTPFNNTLTSTAGWFKTSGSVANHKSIIHFGKTAAKPFYDVSLSGAGRVVFSFSGATTGTGATTCISSGATRYDNQLWHHFVAEKTGLNSCSLYVDSLSPVNSTGTCGASCNNAVTGAYYVGYDPANATNAFPGYIDDVIHWNNAQITKAQVPILTTKTSYGTTAHTLNIALERVDSTNTNVLQVINTGVQTATFPFYDPITNNNVAYSTLASANYTTGNLASVLFNANDRLRLKMNWVATPATGSYMNMTIREDDNTLANPLTTFLQVPGSTTSFPGYLTYTIGATGPTLYIQNSGPNAAWLSALTRLSFAPASGTGTSFGAAINTINSTYAISSSRDGPLFQVGQTEVLNFYTPSNPACAKVAGDQCNSGFATITPGNYKMSAFLSGFDTTGQIFLRTVYIGPVKVQ